MHLFAWRHLPTWEDQFVWQVWSVHVVSWHGYCMVQSDSPLCMITTHALQQFSSAVTAASIKPTTISTQQHLKVRWELQSMSHCFQELSQFSYKCFKTWTSFSTRAHFKAQAQILTFCLYVMEHRPININMSRISIYVIVDVHIYIYIVAFSPVFTLSLDFQ